MKPLPQQYDHKVTEAKWQNDWHSSGVYNWDENETRENTYVIDTPPPTVSGTLHMGHIFSYTQADFIARYQRMAGKTVFYPMGFDDNGLPTERLVEKVKKVRATDMSREDFIKLCEGVAEEARGEFRRLFESVALSVDWNQEYHTISDDCRTISQMSFLDLFEKDRAYRKLQPMLWDPVDQTAIAQAEVEDKECPSQKNYIHFGLIDKSAGSGDWKSLQKVEIMTTRPELLGACVALMCHPDDAHKYEGKEAVTPVFSVRVPIVADPKVDKEKGTGLVMCCTFGDETDIHWWREHKLATRVILNKYGKVGESIAADCSINFESWEDGELNRNNTLDLEKTKSIYEQIKGLKSRTTAREKMLELLAAEGAIFKEPEKGVHAEPCAERSGSPLEILPTNQWFIKILDQKEQLKEKAAECNWYPEYMKVRIDQWIDGLSWDWCISRQRYFGVPFPVWYVRYVEGTNEPPLPWGEGRGEGALVDRARELRKNSTDAEKKLWRNLRDRRFSDYKFRRQMPLYGYIADFVCWERKLIIELDGGQHADQKEYDEKRTKIFEENGFKVLRFWNNDLNNMEGVMLTILSELEGRPLTLALSPRESGLSSVEIIVARPQDLPVNPLVDLPYGYEKRGDKFYEIATGEEVEITPEADVMDTWATSSVSPQLNSRGISDKYAVDTTRHAKLFPADLRPQAHEIIRTWAFYTIVKAHLHEDTIPWKNLMISGWCLAADKTKMSKSKGNVVTPVGLIEDKGADVVRYWASTSRLGADTAYSEDVLKIGRKLVNKIWNATKFAAIHLEKLDKLPQSLWNGNGNVNSEITETLDLWVLGRLNKVVKIASQEFDKYEYCNARVAIEEFFWNDFCDNYLELVKARVYGESDKVTKQQQMSAVYTICHCLDGLLRLFAPFVPHVTEELYTHIFEGRGSAHQRGSWPKVCNIKAADDIEQAGHTCISVLNVIRKMKAERNVSIKWPLNYIAVSGENAQSVLAGLAEDLRSVCNASQILFADKESAGAQISRDKSDDGKFTVTAEFAENSEEKKLLG